MSWQQCCNTVAALLRCALEHLRPDYDTPYGDDGLQTHDEVDQHLQNDGRHQDRQERQGNGSVRHLQVEQNNPDRIRVEQKPLCEAFTTVKH